MTEHLVRQFRANQEIIRILEISKNLSETIFDDLPVVLILLDDSMRILKINRQGQSYIGVNEADALGSNISTLLPERESEKVAGYFADSFGSKSASLSFESGTTVEGKQRWFHWHLDRVHGATTSNARVHVLIGNDTTEARSAFEKWLGLKQDIEIGTTVQSMLLPKESILRVGKTDVAVYYEPSAQVSGDFWWSRSWPGVGTLVVVCDVMGHGVGSAIASAAAVGGLETLFAVLERPTPDDIAKQLLILDSVLSKRFENNLLFCMTTLWISELSTDVAIWSCGLPVPLFVDKTGKQRRVPVSSRGPIGLGFGVNLVPTTIQVCEEEVLSVFSDGCYEFQDGNDQFGRTKLNKFLIGNAAGDPEYVVKTFGAMHKTKRMSDHPTDDVTLLFMKRRSI
jgi:PAS domain S-box-containing protein